MTQRDARRVKHHTLLNRNQGLNPDHLKSLLRERARDVKSAPEYGWPRQRNSRHEASRAYRHGKFGKSPGDVQDGVKTARPLRSGSSTRQSGRQSTATLQTDGTARASATGPIGLAHPSRSRTARSIRCRSAINKACHQVDQGIASTRSTARERRWPDAAGPSPATHSFESQGRAPSIRPEDSAATLNALLPLR